MNGLLLLALLAAGDAGILIDSTPSGAAVFSKQRGSLDFLGFTPLRLDETGTSGRELIVSKTGYESRRLTAGNRDEITVALVRERSIETAPASIQKACTAKDLDAYSDMVDAFRDTRTSLQIDTPFEFIDAAGGASLMLVARVVDRSVRADLRRTRRRRGIQALEEQLAGQLAPVVDAIIAHVREMPCIHYLGIRAVYADSALELDIKRVQVPWMQTYVARKGSDVVHTTKYGMRGENVSSVRVAEGDGRFIDFFFATRPGPGDPGR